MSFASPFPPVQIPDVSLFEYVFGAPGRLAGAERTAFIDAVTGEVVDFRQVHDRALAGAGALAALGIAPGDVVALIAPNSPEYGIAFHAILRAGAAVTTMPLLATPADVARQIQASGAVALIADPAVASTALAGAATAGLPEERVLLLGSADADAASPATPCAADVLRNPAHATGIHSATATPATSATPDAPRFASGARPRRLSELSAQGHPAPDVTIDPATHVAALPYSSGTTGRPKGVRLSHRNLVANLAQIDTTMGATPDDVIVAVLPFFHIYGMIVLLNLALRLRSTLVTMPRFDLAKFLETMAVHRVTWAFIAPPIAVALAKHPSVDDYDLSELRVVFSGAAPLDGELGKAMQDRLGVTVVQGYGMSELSPVSHLTPVDRTDVPCDSVGFAIPNTENKLLDPLTGAEIPLPEGDAVSARGEMCVKGPNVMLGYLDDTAATDAMIDADGFLHTGDIATVDARGVVTIVDRIKELIKYKGYQVAPAELEALLLTHPSIADAAVIGVRAGGAADGEAGSDGAGEEVPKAFVVRRTGTELTAQQVMDFVAGQVAPYKKVRRVEFLDAVPKSASGKILRRELRDRERGNTPSS